MINSLELFSGAGGLAKGIEMAGARHRAFVEWNSDACKTLRRNYPSEIVFESDIRDVQFSQFHNIDFIAGGSPCQPFSIGGKSKGNEDKRDMFPHAISAIRQLMPKAFMFENVKGLLRQSFAEYFNYIILQLTYPQILAKDQDWRTNAAALGRIHASGDFEGLKYNVKFKLLNAADYGVPQKRERVVIVGIRGDLDISWDFPKVTHSEDALLWEKYVTGNYWERHNISPSQSEMSQAQAQETQLKRRYGIFPPEETPWVTVRDALQGLPCPHEHGCADDEHLLRKGAKEYAGHTGSEIDQPSKTIKAGNHGVPGGENMIKYPDGKVRYYTILEAKRIQTFPDDYHISGSWSEAMRQLGNAVPVRLANVIAKSLFDKVFPNQLQQATFKNVTTPKRLETYSPTAKIMQ